MALQVHSLDDPDTWWHLASGRLIASSGTVARVDPFSYTAPGAEWINRQWLFDVGAYAAWRAGGPAGPTLAAGAFFAAGFAALYALARRRLPVWAAASLVVLATQVAVERLAVRPEAVTFFLLALYLLVLDGRPLRPLWLVVLLALQVLWANCHALSVLGVVVLAAETASAAAGLLIPLPAGWRGASRRDARTVAGLVAATAGALAAEAATPFGLRGAVFPLRLLDVLRGAEVTSRTIIEHRPPTFADLSPPVTLGMVALLALAALAAVFSWRRWRLAHVLTAGAFAGLALMARRNVALLGPGVLPLVASGLSPAAAAADRWLRRRPILAAVSAGALAIAFAAATAGVVTGSYYDAARLTRTFGLGVSGVWFPAGAVDFLDARPPSERVFNDDILGGYLLWRTYPRRRVFIDGRLQVYPPAVYAEYESVLEDPSNFPVIAARYGITAAILYHPAPGRLEVARAIASLPGWRIAYLDGGAVVLVSDGGGAGLPAGIEGPPLERRPTPLDRLLARVQFPIEEATAHYQRGRALLYLFGPEGVARARADFEAARLAWPEFEAAAIGLQATEPPR